MDPIALGDRVSSDCDRKLPLQSDDLLRFHRLLTFRATPPSLSHNTAANDGYKRPLRSTALESYRRAEIDEFTRSLANNIVSLVKEEFISYAQSESENFERKSKT